MREFYTAQEFDMLESSLTSPISGAIQLTLGLASGTSRNPSRHGLRLGTADLSTAASPQGNEGIAESPP